MGHETESIRQFYSWEQFDTDCFKLEGLVTLDPYPFDSIFGIPRGGLVVAVKLSHLLGLPLVLNPKEITNETLIVDDICDSGETLERLLFGLGERNVEPRVATLFWNDKEELFKPDYWIRKKKDWVVFPWEKEESSKYDHTF